MILLLPPDENALPEIESGVSLRHEYFKEDQKKGSPQLSVCLLFRNLICGKVFNKVGLKNIFKVFFVENFEQKEEENAKNDWEKKKSNKKPMDYPFEEKIRSWVKDRYLKHYV